MTYRQGYMEAGLRVDALVCKKGKACGDRCIPRDFECKTGSGGMQQSAKALALGAGALGGAVLLSQGTRQVNRQIDRKIQKPVDEIVDKAVDDVIARGKGVVGSVKERLKRKPRGGNN